ncbi:MAG: RagB/SusD family nutrient uptake outer membrane protein, partial [Bacteroidales bacterium]|nr:RagB/SusD family nutrient uptake outer membrane protein [Bacteroidales bacterium]
MKKIYYSFISVFVLALSGCSGMLEPEPYGLVELDLVWTKYNYTASYADRLGANNEWTGGFDYSAYTDEAQDVTDRIGGNYYNWNTSDFSASNFPLKGNYFNAYNNIRTSAYYLNNEYKISYDGLDPNERNFWIAKAHVTRAWHYFDLMRRYGKAVLFDEVFAPDEDFTDVHISGPEAIADFIMEDLDAALEIPEAESSPYAFRWQLT